MRPKHITSSQSGQRSRRALQAMEDPKGRQGFPGAQHPPPGYQAGYPAGAPPPAPYGGYTAGAGAAPYYAPGAPAPPADAVSRGISCWTSYRAHLCALCAVQGPLLSCGSGPARAVCFAACAPALLLAYSKWRAQFLVCSGRCVLDTSAAVQGLCLALRSGPAGLALCRVLPRCRMPLYLRVCRHSWLHPAPKTRLLASTIWGYSQMWPARSGAPVRPFCKRFSSAWQRPAQCLASCWLSTCCVCMSSHCAAGLTSIASHCSHNYIHECCMP